jgi:hypothetical protein
MIFVLGYGIIHHGIIHEAALPGAYSSTRSSTRALGELCGPGRVGM